MLRSGTPQSQALYKRRKRLVQDVALLIAGGVISWLVARYYFTRKKKWSDKLTELDSHLEYISKLRRSSIELNRQAFRFVFLILGLISAGLFVDSLPEYMTFGAPGSKAIGLAAPFKFVLYFSAIMFAFLKFRTFNDVINYKKAAKRIAEKRQQYEKKLDNV